jgi:hypothetical protein
MLSEIDRLKNEICELQNYIYSSLDNSIVNGENLKELMDELEEKKNKLNKLENDRK